MLAPQRETGRCEETQGLVTGRIATDAARALRRRRHWHCTAWHVKFEADSRGEKKHPCQNDRRAEPGIGGARPPSLLCVRAGPCVPSSVQPSVRGWVPVSGCGPTSSSCRSHHKGPAPTAQQAGILQTRKFRASILGLRACKKRARASCASDW